MVLDGCEGIEDIGKRVIRGVVKVSVKRTGIRCVEKIPRIFPGVAWIEAE